MNALRSATPRPAPAWWQNPALHKQVAARAGASQRAVREALKKAAALGLLDPGAAVV